jgi:mitogen-activated protein kinase 15
LVRSFANFNSGGTPTLTEGVATRWYRAPEILLGSTCYSTPADIWSFGCIIFEIVTKKPMLPGENIADQIQKIIEYSGYPTEEQIKSVKSNVVK